MSDGDYLELLELQEIIREGVEDAIPGMVRVRAEIASLQHRANGHCYLELCESGPTGPVAKVRAVIWRSRWNEIIPRFAKAAGQEPAPGMALIFEVGVNYSALYGLTLSIEDIDVEHTIGEAELQRRKTIERLEKEGLIDLQKELALPDIPYSIAVISASDAAGYGDFRRHLLENEYGFAFGVELFPALMQGESSPASICEALGRIADSGRQYDAVFILRGGGSSLDLSCFDDYGLCAAIARFPMPVYTAIGHDRDVHAADLVACGSVKTPTALADLCIDCVAAEDERISALATRLRLGFANKISAQESALVRLCARLSSAALRKLAAEEARLSGLEARIGASDPRKLLARGYALVTDPAGRIVKSASGAKDGDRLDIRYSDGTLKVHVDGRI